MGVFKNGVGRPSNETIKKRNIFKGICVVLFIVIIGLVVYILNDKGIINIGGKDDKKIVDNKVNKDTTKENKKENISLNNDMVKDLYNRVSGTDIFNSEFTDTAGKEVYLQETLYDKDGKIVYAKDLSDDFKASMTLNYILPKNDFSQKENVSYDKQKEAYEKIFGTKYDIKDFYNYGLARGDTKLDNKNIYIVPDYIGIDPPYGIGRTLVKAEKDNNRIYLYEALWYNDAEKYMGNEYNGELSYFNQHCDYNATCNAIFKSKNPSDDENVIANKDKFTQFKFSFTKQNGNNYVFECVQKVK